MNSDRGSADNSLGRRLHIAVVAVAADGKVSSACERTFESTDEVWLASSGNGPIVVPRCSGPAQLIIAPGPYVQMSAGMSVNMDAGADAHHLRANFEELVAAGLPTVILIAGRGMKLRIRPGLLVFAKFVV